MKIHSKLRPALACLALGAFLSARPLDGQDGPSFHDRSAMKEIDLRGLRVWYGKPVQITEQIGFGTVWAISKRQRGWSFVHLTPFLARFPRGNLIATYTDDSDGDDNPFYLSAFQISRDGGARWGRRYPLLMQHIGMVYIPKQPDSLLAVPSEWTYRSPGDRKNFVAPSYLFEEGGAKLLTVPDGGRIVDWPWDTLTDGNGGAGTGSPQPPENWHVRIYVTGDAVNLGGRWLASAYCKKGDSPYYDAVVVASEDGGYTWRYLSTIAAPNLPRDSRKVRYEGPNECSMVQLADGDLMAVARIGSGLHLVQCYSRDGGRSWSRDEEIAPFSVSPQLVRIANRTILLGTGRPGIGLWLSTDSRAATWQQMDIVACHNAWASPDPNTRISRIPQRNPKLDQPKWQTSSYTGIVEIAPNRILLIYDRNPEWIPADEKDVSRLYVMPIEIERSPSSR